MTLAITAEWNVDEVLRQYPAAGPVFLQGGRMMHAPTGQIYPTYPPLTVAEYAALNGMDLGALLKRLNVLAEAEEFTRVAPALPGEDGPEAR